MLRGEQSNFHNSTKVWLSVGDDTLTCNVSERDDKVLNQVPSRMKSRRKRIRLLQKYDNRKN